MTEYVSVKCGHDEHGSEGYTFKMPKLRVKLSKAADLGFTCPKGHSRTWKDHIVESAKDDFKDYVRRESDFEEERRRLKKEKRKAERKRDKMKNFFKRHLAGSGVIELPNSEYTWKCSCGSTSSVFKRTKSQAETLYEQHLDNQHGGEEPGDYRCSGCGEVFDNQQVYASHCGRCDKVRNND